MTDPIISEDDSFSDRHEELRGRARAHEGHSARGTMRAYYELGDDTFVHVDERMTREQAIEAIETLERDIRDFEAQIKEARYDIECLKDWAAQERGWKL